MPSQYISELLKKNKRAIIPQIGAFMLKNDGNKETITFNSILKFDDGNLAKMIEEKEKTSKEIAKKRVVEFAEKIEKELNSGKQFEISGVGNMYKDANGRVQILTGSQKNTNTNTQQTAESGLLNKPETPKTTAKETKPSTPVSGTTKTTPSKEPTKPGTDAGAPKTLNDRFNNAVTNNPAEKSSAQSSVKNTSGAKPSVLITNKNIPPPTPPKNPGTTKSQSSSSGAPKKKSNGFLWVSVIVLLIAAGITAYLLFFKQTTPKIDDSLLEDAALTESMEEQEMSYEELAEDSIVATDDTSIIDEENTNLTNTENISNEVENTDETNAYNTPAGNKYYIVAGCFQIESNADKYTQKLQNEGYDAKKFGFLRGMHAVSYAEFDSRQEALVQLQKIRGSREPNAWLIKY
jgi:nucleoid DNA-binding protein/flagellar basal body-associated protein FliL